MTDRETRESSPQLSPALQTAIETFRDWAEEFLRSEQKKQTLDDILYHYTDARGLQGIVESGEIWFSDYRHVNDPSELRHGINVAHEIARTIGSGAHAHVKLFLKTFTEAFRQSNFDATSEFFIASFSLDRDDLGQWRAYGDNGRGFAIGFAPGMFRRVDKRPEGWPSESIGPVRYSVDDERTRTAIEHTASVILNAGASGDLEDEAAARTFMASLAQELITQPLLWNALTSKHSAYKNEQEVRLVITGTEASLAQAVKTRLRDNEIIPYIGQPMPVREPGSIRLIRIGPAAPKNAERNVRKMLDSFGIRYNIAVERSDIPYRAL